MERKIRAFAPATVSNVCAGFDVFGFAVDSPGDEVEARSRNEPGVAIAAIHGDNGRLPLQAERNTAGVAAIAFLRHIKASEGAMLELFKKMPLGSGMGSSAASAAAALCAVNELFGRPLSREQLLPFAMEAERVACGSAHADNVAPSLLGGFVLVRGTEPLDVVRLPTPENLYCALVHPHIEVLTSVARKILPERILLRDAVRQWGNTAGLAAGLALGDLALVGRSLQDLVIEPVRAGLIPHFAEVKAAALDAGALGAGISGSGPSIFALAEGRKTAETAGGWMRDCFLSHDIGCELHVSGINSGGAVVIPE